MLRALALTLPHHDALLGLGLLGGSRHPNRAAPGSLLSQWGLGLQRLHKCHWSQAEGISSSYSLSANASRWWCCHELGSVSPI